MADGHVSGIETADDTSHTLTKGTGLRLFNYFAHYIDGDENGNQIDILAVVPLIGQDQDSELEALHDGVQ